MDCIIEQSSAYASCDSTEQGVYYANAGIFSFKSREPPPMQRSPPSVSTVELGPPGSPCHTPGIPHPRDIIQPARLGRKYYVVFAGTRVGIFGDWFGQVVRYTQGVSGGHQRGYSRFSDALAAYTAAYQGLAGYPSLQILPETENTCMLVRLAIYRLIWSRLISISSLICIHESASCRTNESATQSTTSSGSSTASGSGLGTSSEGETGTGWRGSSSGWGNSFGWGSSLDEGTGRGWGMSSNSEWGWGRRSPSPQLVLGALVARSPLNNLRSDFHRAGLTWEGTSNRPTHLDHEDTRFWAQFQCEYFVRGSDLLAEVPVVDASSERSVANHLDLPTFTGPQIEERIASLEVSIGEKEVEIEAAEAEVNVARAALNISQTRENCAREELRDL
ncbi:hypothetical protein GYMLUDRAFT_62721 [Collybiopsis luxurians FD-317 M1]|uniref:Uncharacterized protein n=1 Tax=Collybiopsis luxurians FD-317 M1 TaxID=944289 RepID=A0A0D0CAR2_9AGAR|nr:hypothetical protein GYMLUDRAFT_62721 [Collybiopsis luxurians FD-317 M1]